MGSARLSSHDPRCYHPQCSSALCCCELLPWSRVTEAAVILSIAAAVGWLCGLKHWWAESTISAEQQVLLTLMPLLQEHWLWREKEGWTDGVIMPSATLAGLPEPPASSNSISALYPHKWIFCFSNTSTNFPVANSKPLPCCLPCAHPNVQKPESNSPSHVMLKHLKTEFYTFAFWYLNCTSITDTKSIFSCCLVEFFFFMIKLNFYITAWIPRDIVNPFLQDIQESLEWPMGMPEQCMSKLWSQICAAVRLCFGTCMGNKEKLYPVPTPPLEKVPVIVPWSKGGINSLLPCWGDQRRTAQGWGSCTLLLGICVIPRGEWITHSAPC